jgi:hypothetical protein
MTWYLRSIGDRDAHCGELMHPDGMVTAACGGTIMVGLAEVTLVGMLVADPGYRQRSCS